ncbi:hypothetical protein [Weissella cibaria]|uniref:Uncharacterized protein n=1 Tax=Weissella cibaria TaxID=137591 RepID=A0A2S1KRS3_9LACO|nr:hypothetical protein [Weissella cibaria]AWF95690.1 hypothetical protein B6254_1286 [Weissella cibaria]
MGFKQKREPLLSSIKLAELRRPKVDALSLLPYKRFVGEDNLLLLVDEKGEEAGYMEMLTILGKDLDFVYGQNSEGASAIIRDYHLLLNTYTTDFDIVITQMAAETTVQQRAWLAQRDTISTQLASERDPRKYKQLQVRYQLVERQLASLRHVAEKVKHQSYTAFIYGDSVEETRLHRDIFMSSGGQAITTKTMSLDKKHTMLAILQDPTQQLNQ